MSRPPRWWLQHRGLGSACRRTSYARGVAGPGRPIISKVGGRIDARPPLQARGTRPSELALNRRGASPRLPFAKRPCGSGRAVRYRSRGCSVASRGSGPGRSTTTTRAGRESTPCTSELFLPRSRRRLWDERLARRAGMSTFHVLQVVWRCAAGSPARRSEARTVALEGGAGRRDGRPVTVAAARRALDGALRSRTLPPPHRRRGRGR